MTEVQDLVVKHMEQNPAKLWLHTYAGQWYNSNFADNALLISSDFRDMKPSEKRYETTFLPNKVEEEFLVQLDTDGIECQGPNGTFFNYPWVLREDLESQYEYLIYSSVIEPYHRTIREFVKRVYYSGFIGPNDVQIFMETPIHDLLICTLVDGYGITDFAKNRSYLLNVNYNLQCTCMADSTTHHLLCPGANVGPPRSAGARQRCNLAQWEKMTTVYLNAWIASFNDTIEVLRIETHNDLLVDTPDVEHIIQKELEKLSVELDIRVECIPNTLHDAIVRVVHRENPAVDAEMTRHDLITKVFQRLRDVVEYSCAALLKKADEFLAMSD